MSKLFQVDINTGSFKDRVTGTRPTNTGVTMTQQEKGTVALFGAANSLDGYGAVTGIKTLALILRPAGDTTLVKDNGAGVLSISGGSFAASGMTATYVNNTASAVALQGQWQLVLCEFSAGLDVATDFELATSAAVDIAAVWCTDVLYSSAERTALYQAFLARWHISKPIVTKALSNVARFSGNTAKNYVSVSTTAALPTNEFTMCGMIRSPDPNNYKAIFRLYGFPTFQGLFLHQLKLNAFYGTSHLSASLVPVDTWFFFGLRVASGTLHFFIDSVKDANSYTFTDTYSPNVLYFGNDGQAATYYLGQMYNMVLYDVALSDADMLTLAQEGAIGTNPIHAYALNEGGGDTAIDSAGGVDGSYRGTQPHGQSRHAMQVAWDADDMPADGQSFTAGRIDRDLSVGSGAFVREEVAAGKQIRCTTAGTLIMQGVNLSEFTGDGYIRELGGDLSGDAGGTVSAASAVSFADNTLTFVLTKDQVITSFVIAKD